MKDITRRTFLKTAGLTSAGLVGSLVFPESVFAKPNITLEEYALLPKNKKWNVASKLLHRKYTLNGKKAPRKITTRMFDELSEGLYSANNKPISTKDTEDLIAHCAHYKSDAITDDFFLALIEEESRRKPNNVSSIGAGGLTQIISPTWNQHQDKDFYTNVFIPEENIYTGTSHLKWLEKYCSNEKTGCPEWEHLNKESQQALILAAYHGGARRLKKTNWQISNMPSRTRAYVRKAMKKLI